MNGEFRSNLRGGKTMIGTMVTLPCPGVSEILSDTGFDWLFIDGEHAPFSGIDIQAVLQSVLNNVACIVRVPSADEVPIKQVLDLGADGVIAPQVNTVQQAESVVRYARYSPEGSRGVGLGRAHGYGMKFQQYLDTANERVTVVVQAEHAEAVENIESIVKVSGIDVVLIGPYDLAASLGKMGQVDDPAVTDAIDHITTTCLNAGIRLGIFGVTADAVQAYIDRGYTLIIVGTDALFLGNAAKAAISQLR